MGEHDDDLDSTVVEGEELEQDAFNVEEEPLEGGDEEAPDEAAPVDEAPSVDDGEL